MRQPPDYLLPLLYSIESVAVEIKKEFPRLVDKDVEWAYEKLADYYKVKSKGKEIEEPLSPSEMKQALIDEILNNLEAREEAHEDEDLIDNPYAKMGEFTYQSLEQLYATVFKLLKNSARFWRKKEGPTGYLNFISEHL